MDFSFTRRTVAVSNETIGLKRREAGWPRRQAERDRTGEGTATMPLESKVAVGYGGGPISGAVASTFVRDRPVP